MSACVSCSATLRQTAQARSRVRSPSPIPSPASTKADSLSISHFVRGNPKNHTSAKVGIGAVGKHLAGIVGQSFRACFAVMDTGGCVDTASTKALSASAPIWALKPRTARFPLCSTLRASSSSSLMGAMMVASTSVPVLIVTACDLSCAITGSNRDQQPAILGEGGPLGLRFSCRKIRKSAERRDRLLTPCKAKLLLTYRTLRHRLLSCSQSAENQQSTRLSTPTCPKVS